MSEVRDSMDAISRCPECGGVECSSECPAAHYGARGEVPGRYLTGTSQVPALGAGRAPAQAVKASCTEGDLPDDCDRMAYVLREIYEWTKHEPTTLDNDDCTQIFRLVCYGLGVPFEGDLDDA